MDLKKSGSRNSALDAIGGFYIILMMFQHFNVVTMQPHTIGHLFMFNTIWFFFKSGMFHRPQSDLKPFMIKMLRKLGIPFVVFSIFGAVLWFATEWYTTEHINHVIFYSVLAQIFHTGAFWWNIPLWFLVTMFFVRITTAKYDGSYSLIYILFGLTIAFIHYEFIKGADDYNFIGNYGIALVFYILGAKSKDMIPENRWIYIMMAIIFFAIFLFMPTAFDVFGNRPRYGSYWMGIVVAYIGIILMNKLLVKASFLHSKILVYIGQNAMLLLVIHVPIFMAVYQVCGEKMSVIAGAYSGMTIGICTLLICLVVTKVFSKIDRVQWIIGN